MATMDAATHCSYQRTDGSYCPAPPEGENALCFWHDPAIDKGGDDIGPRLEEWARSGESMQGFALRRAQLSGVRLYYGQGADLRGADLSRADLRGASMFDIDLRGANLMKADASGANLNHAHLQGANLLGIRLDGAKLERIEWGEQLLQEEAGRRAARAGKAEEARNLFLEARETYRALRLACDKDPDAASQFFYREMCMRHETLPRWSSERAWSRLVDLFCGYGEKPQRVIGFSAFFIAVCAAFYFALGVRGYGRTIGLSLHKNLTQNARDFFDCLYYSCVTFTTLGYGDITPGPHAKLVAAIEAFVGAFFMALFIIVFSRKMTR